MKYVVFTIQAVFFMLTVAAQAQQPFKDGYKVYYNMTFQRDTNDAQLTSEMTELLIGDNRSLFRTVLQAEKDTNRYHRDQIDHSLINVFTSARYRILKNHEDQASHFYEVIEILGGPMCTYAEPRDSMGWFLTKDTLTIHGYPCQKAWLNYGNRLWEAWFTPDIPLSEGPYKFWGLPGLIVRIRDSKASWMFELHRIERVPAFTFDLWFLEDAEAMGKLDFYKRKRHHRDNQMEIYEAAGKIGPFESEAVRQRLFKKAKAHAAKDNNWIERYP
ncbi:GLPGLI family protein [Parapedobacter luteus]|uniref:GLPGLI family protein n=1 Tax=Parapedobacter luteus TaxID=623280 RepID=A0A1T4ZUI6_9SPHI|nr:GLPGLI family protein [Parapedobacter luteus]SKB26421.1 GLPGLI family protein [Parapedobacter luteus]